MVWSTIAATLGILALSAAPMQTPPPIKDPVAEIEARRVAAEADVKQLRAKGAEPSQAAREAYAAAVKTHNQWVETFCEHLDKGATASPDLDTLAKTAADAFTAWYVAKMRALGLTIIPSAPGILTTHTLRVLKAAATSATGRGRGDGGQDSATLRRRLSWKAWEEVG